MPIKDYQRRHIGARNERAIDHAKRSIATLGEVAQRQNANAILPDGRLAVFYLIKTSGKRCTCASTKTMVLDELGNMPTNVLNQVLNNDIIITDDDDYSKVNTNNNSADIIIASDDDTPVEYESTINGILEDEVIDDTDLVEDVSPDYDLAPAYATNCPICYGTGYVGGFTVLFGSRYIIEAYSSNYTGQLENERPLAVSIADDEYIEFEFVVPIQTVSVVTFQLWYKRHRLNMPMMLDGTIVNKFNILSVCKDKGLLGKSIKIVVSNPFANSLNDETHKVTHLEFQAMYKDFYVDVSNTENLSTEEFYQTSDITVVMPPVISNPNIRGSVIAVNNRHVKVRSVNTTVDNTARVWNIELSTRPVQPYEIYGTLFTPIDRFPVYGTNLLSHLLYDTSSNSYSYLHDQRYVSIANEVFSSEIYTSNSIYKDKYSPNDYFILKGEYKLVALNNLVPQANKTDLLKDSDFILTGKNGYLIIRFNGYYDTTINGFVNVSLSDNQTSNLQNEFTFTNTVKYYEFTVPVTANTYNVEIFGTGYLYGIEVLYVSE